MNSFHYLPPEIPSREVLADMILWHSSAEMRQELLLWEREDLDKSPLDELVDQTINLLETWRPTSDYQYTVARKARELDWLVWQVAQQADQFWEQTFQGLDLIEPWAIVLDTLPRYGHLPTAIVEPD